MAGNLLRLDFLLTQLVLIILGVLEGAEDLVHEHKIMSVVGLVVGVVDGVVLGPEDGPDLAVDVVVDIGSPDAGGKEQQLMREEMHRAEEESPSIGDGLRAS